MLAKETPAPLDILAPYCLLHNITNFIVKTSDSVIS